MKNLKSVGFAICVIAASVYLYNVIWWQLEVNRLQVVADLSEAKLK